MLMANTHVAHDAQLGNGVKMANGSEVAGHVQIGDNALLYAHTGVQHFARIGERTLIAAHSSVRKDIPPFTAASGREDACVVGINGRLRFRENEKVSTETLQQLRHAFRLCFEERLSAEEAERSMQTNSPEVLSFFAFLKTASKRGIAYQRKTPSNR